MKEEITKKELKKAILMAKTEIKEWLEFISECEKRLK